MNHCQGGVGTDTFDKVAAIEQWMAQGRAPEQIVASHATDGKIDRTRPLCPYPQVAVYRGSRQHRRGIEFLVQGRPMMRNADRISGRGHLSLVRWSVAFAQTPRSRTIS